MRNQCLVIDGAGRHTVSKQRFRNSFGRRGWSVQARFRFRLCTSKSVCLFPFLTLPLYTSRLAAAAQIQDALASPKTEENVELQRASRAHRPLRNKERRQRRFTTITVACYALPLGENGVVVLHQFCTHTLVGIVARGNADDVVVLEQQLRHVRQPLCHGASNPRQERPLRGVMAFPAHAIQNLFWKKKKKKRAVRNTTRVRSSSRR